jgi:hypothetical protein
VIKALKNDPYPKLSQNIHKDELIACYTLDDFDWNIVKKARTKTSQLALAITLKTFQNLGYFVEDVSEIPQDILNFIKKQLSDTSNATLSYYYKNKIRRYRLTLVSGLNPPQFFCQNLNLTIYQHVSKFEI